MVPSLAGSRLSILDDQSGCRQPVTMALNREFHAAACISSQSQALARVTCGSPSNLLMVVEGLLN